ncbi:FAD dependent oxidoreductase [Aquisphaera giovannonii]|uniref:FAD dependent oxidoreductase n=1 Tax=Aquisphaera giovannonii TaxID=406548 RepID=A0A5B9WEA4_9BACT|nr:FAD-dependent oxidoreductase [Aquisphaera giovannonii]QEH38220.1 FAD dependent oxidoreductase [Aquisphaera giovannonii]
MEELRVAIVGGGFSGTMVAVHLARAGGVRVVLAEKGDRLARGAAYGSRCERHLLNVPAGLMSALPDEPSHFLDWLRGRDPEAGAGTFAPRMTYGDYLAGLLGDAASTGRVDLIRDEVVDLEAGPRLVLRTSGGRAIEAERVVLALGNPPPGEPAGMAITPGLRGYVPNPWEPGALDGLAGDEPIGLIGTGLTAVDLVVEAMAKGHRGPIVAISRHGSLPQAHRPSAGPPRPHVLAAGRPATARALLRTVRAEADRCRSEGGDWRSVIDGIRPVAQDVWRSLEVPERDRFLRHLASRWDVHRHRIAPEVEEVLASATLAGRLRVVAGRVESIEPDGDSLAVRVRGRGRADSEVLAFGRLINCTGPSRDIRDRAPMLVRSLFGRGIARPGPLALGLDAGASGALLDRDGNPSDRVFAIGPLLKEGLWETTAVRELRVQARDLAEHLLGRRPAG